MVDEDILEENPLAREGLKMLHQSGVIQLQITRIISNLVNGDPEQKPRDVMLDVILTRRRVANLRILDDLGAQYIRETDNA